MTGSSGLDVLEIGDRCVFVVTRSGYFIWTFSFGFSGRGYWQELIESIVWAHEQTPIANQVTGLAIRIVTGVSDALPLIGPGLVTLHASALSTNS